MAEIKFFGGEIMANVEDGGQNMKVFGCRNQMNYGGGLILVAANTVEEAYLTAAMDGNTGGEFYWHTDDYMWCEPDGKTEHCSCAIYPLDKWFEADHLSTDLTEPGVIIEDSYYE